MLGEISRDVSLWLSADIGRTAPRGPVSARKQTLANRIPEAARSRSAYRSEADIGDEVAQCLLMTQTV